MERNPMKIICDIGRLTLIAIPLLTAATFSSCSQDEDVAASAQQAGRLVLNATVDNGWSETTRGQRANALEESFGLFGYNYPGTWGTGAGMTANWLCDAEVSVSADGWVTTSLVSTEGCDDYFQFFGYYPFLHEEFSAEEEVKYLNGMPYTVTTTNQTNPDTQEEEEVKTVTLKEGNPVFNFVTSENAVDMVDFLVGASLERVKATLLKTPIEIKFRHALAGVIFKVGSFTEPMTINKIELTNVNTTGRLQVAPPTGEGETAIEKFANWANTASSLTWTNLGTPKTVYVEPSFKIRGNYAGEVGRTINDNDLVMFLIPQDLPSTAAIRMTVNDDLVLTKQINATGTTPLQRGKITKFTLSVTSMQQLRIDTQITDWGEGMSFSGSGTDGNSILSSAIIDDWGTGTTTEMTNETGSGN